MSNKILHSEQYRSAHIKCEYVINGSHVICLRHARARTRLPHLEMWACAAGRDEKTWGSPFNLTRTKSENSKLPTAYTYSGCAQKLTADWSSLFISRSFNPRRAPRSIIHTLDCLLLVYLHQSMLIERLSRLVVKACVFYGETARSDQMDFSNCTLSVVP